MVGLPGNRFALVATQKYQGGAPAAVSYVFLLASDGSPLGQARVASDVVLGPAYFDGVELGVMAMSASQSAIYWFGTDGISLGQTVLAQANGVLAKDPVDGHFRVVFPGHPVTFATLVQK